MDIDKLNMDIMNIPCKRTLAEDAPHNDVRVYLAYKEGHRDARHAACEVVLEHNKASGSDGTAAANAAGLGAFGALLVMLDTHMYANDYGGLEVGKHHSSDVVAAIEAARAALQEQPQPVAWMNPNESCAMDAFLWSRDPQNPRYSVPVFADRAAASPSAEKDTP
jgi:hypothetical protein